MAREGLYFGSLKGGLTELVPQEKKGSHAQIRAFSKVEVAALRMILEDDMRFYLDGDHGRLYLPTARIYEGLRRHDKPGSLYVVKGNFSPTSNSNLGEQYAPRATVLRELPILGVFWFLANRQVSVFAGKKVFDEIEEQWCDKRTFPPRVPYDVKPVDLKSWKTRR
jgi:hypothetical protein